MPKVVIFTITKYYFAVDKEFDKGQESVFSNKVRAGRRRTYFFDVRKTKGDDYYITLTESTKRFNGDGYNRHKIFLYKEDFNRFMEGLQDAVNHVKTDLMPDYDYEQFDRRQEEWEKSMKEKAAEEAAAAAENPTTETASETETEASSTETPAEETPTEETTTPDEPTSEGESSSSDVIESDEDMDW